MGDRTLAQYFIITLKGMAMGAADVVPGVSGGTIAFISGIYEELITSINNINWSLIRLWRTSGIKAVWKQINGNFLLALVIGIAISIFSLAKFIGWLLENEPVLLWSFFFGLVLASILFVGKAIEKWNAAAVFMLVFGAGIAYFVTTLPPTSNATALPFLFLSGALAICAMILPGISGAFILVLLGAYKTVLDAVDAKDFKILITVALGALFGLLSFSRLLKWMFNHHRNMTLAMLTGFIIGSLNKIWPWKKVLESRTYGSTSLPVSEVSVSPFAYEGNPDLLGALLLAAIGFSLILILEKAASKNQ